MTFEEARRTLREIVEDAGEAPNTLVPTEQLINILGGFDNDEQVMFMHNIAVTLLLRLGGEAELQPEEALATHRTHKMQFSRSTAGTMLLKIVNKTEADSE